MEHSSAARQVIADAGRRVWQLARMPRSAVAESRLTEQLASCCGRLVATTEQDLRGS